MPKHDLEAQLLAVTQEFVGKLVHVIRNASFAEVAALPETWVETRVETRGNGAATRAQPPAKRVASSRPPNSVSHPSRQTAAVRAELGERVVEALRMAGRPLGVRTLSTDLGVTPEILGTPLRELRSAGRIQKEGEKRATRYYLL